MQSAALHTARSAATPRTTERLSIAAGALLLMGVVMLTSGCDGRDTGSVESSRQSTSSPAAVASTQPADTVVEPADDATPPVVADGQTLVAIHVAGMHCTGCAAGLKDIFREQPGVADAKVSFEAETAWLLLPKDAAISLSALQSAIADTGLAYTLTPIADASTDDRQDDSAASAGDAVSG